MAYPRIPDRIRRAIAREVSEKNLPVQRVAARFNVTDSTVRKILRELGADETARARDWFDLPPWERMQSFVMGHNREVYASLDPGPEPVAVKFGRP